MPDKDKARKRLAGALLFGGLAAVSLLAWSARWSWVGELAANLGWQLGWVTVAGGALLAALGSRRLGLAAAVLGTVHLAPELSLWVPEGRPTEATGPSFTLLSANVLWGNPEQGAALDWILEIDADVAVVLEVSEDARRELEAAREAYPYQLYSPASGWNRGTWGSAVLAKTAFDAARLVVDTTYPARPPMEVRLQLGGRTVTVRGVHTVRPGLPPRIERRDEELRVLAGLDWGGASVLAGDLNVTSTSPVFRELLARSGLRDSRRGWGRQPTFRVGPARLRIAIDHVLASEAVDVLERRTLEVPGSDHRAVFTRLSIRGR